MKWTELFKLSRRPSLGRRSRRSLPAMRPVLCGRGRVERLEDRALLAAVTVHHAPYLQLGDAPLQGVYGTPAVAHGTTDQIEILWQTKPDGSASGDDTFAVWYRPTAGSWLAVAENAPLGPFTDEAGQTRVNHSVTIAGLAYDSDYEYRVEHLRDGAPLATYSSGFHTRLDKGAETPFTFVAYGDSAYPPNLTPFRNVQAAINGLNPAFSLLLGDNVYSQGLHTEFDARLSQVTNPEAAANISRRIDYWGNGNHDDDTNNGQPSRDNYSTPIPQLGVTSPVGLTYDATAVQPEENYSFDYGSVHFLTFNSAYFFRAGLAPANEALDRILDWAVADIAAAGAQWNIVYFHHAFASSFGHTAPVDERTRNFFDKIVSRLGGAGVDLILDGHSHIYERSYPLLGRSADAPIFVSDTDNDYAKGAGLVQVTAGMGGNPSLSSGTFKPYVAKGYGASSGLEFGFARIDVTPTALTVRYQDVDGDIKDSFSITDAPDTTPPSAALATPQDNGPGDLYSAAGHAMVRVPLPAIAVQLADSGEGVDDATVIAAAVRLTRDGAALVEGTDYAFSYSSSTHQLTLAALSPLAGQFASGTYHLELNGPLPQIADRAGNPLAPTTLKVTVDTAIPDPVLVARGSQWKYLDNGTDQGTAWRATAFDDSSWAAGPAQLGYGDGDEATVVSYGPNSGAKYITTYFRRAFTVADASRVTALTLDLVRDDGAVVYLNGAELLRSNMPAGAIANSTPASSALGSPQESAWTSFAISPALLVDGANVLAVEIHQANGTSSDISFDLGLTGTANLPPIDAEIPALAGITEGDGLTMAASANDPEGDLLSYLWDIDGDGIFGDILGQNPVLSWATLRALGLDGGALPSTYPLRVRVEDIHGGATVSAPSPLTVGNAPPTAVLGGELTAFAGQSYTVNVTDVLDPGSDVVSSYRLDWGDGGEPESFGTLDPLVHVYATPGQRTIWLDLVDEDGIHAHVASHEVEVLPTADLSIGDAQVSEGGLSGTTSLVFTVTLSAPLAANVTVAYSTVDDSATSPADFAAASGTLTFLAGATAEQVTVVLQADAVVETDESFSVVLSAPVGAGAELVDDAAVGTILNDDSATLSVSDVALAEGTGGGFSAFVFTVSLSAPVDREVRVRFATRDLTATVAGNDYLAAAGTLTFNPMTLVQTLTVYVRRDATLEGNETFAVDLSELTPTDDLSILDGSGLGTILNDDRVGGRPGRP